MFTVKRLSIILFASLLVACGDSGLSESESSIAPTKKTVIHWKLVTTWPKNFPGLGTAPENFAKLVDRMSDGRLKIKVQLLHILLILYFSRYCLGVLFHI